MRTSTSTHSSLICSRFTRLGSGCPPSTQHRLPALLLASKPPAELDREPWEWVDPLEIMTVARISNTRSSNTPRVSPLVRRPAVVPGRGQTSLSLATGVLLAKALRASATATDKQVQVQVQVQVPLETCARTYPTVRGCRQTRRVFRAPGSNPRSATSSRCGNGSLGPSPYRALLPNRKDCPRSPSRTTGVQHSKAYRLTRISLGTMPSCQSTSRHNDCWSLQSPVRPLGIRDGHQTFF